MAEKPPPRIGKNDQALETVAKVYIETQASTVGDCLFNETRRYREAAEAAKTNERDTLIGDNLTQVVIA